MNKPQRTDNVLEQDPNMPRNLLDLPAELRLAIYDHLVQDAEASGCAHVLRLLPGNQWHSSLEECRQKHSHSSHRGVYAPWPVNYDPVYAIAPKSDIRALALTCRKTYSEVAPLLRACNKLTITWRPSLTENEALLEVLGVLDSLAMSPLIIWKMNARTIHIQYWIEEPLYCTEAQRVMSQYLKHELKGLECFIWTLYRKPAFRHRTNTSALAEERDMHFYFMTWTFLKSFMCTNDNRHFVIGLQVDGCLVILARLDNANSTNCVVGVRGSNWRSDDWFCTGIAELRKEVLHARALHKQRMQNQEIDEIGERLEETRVMRETMK